MKNKTKSQDFIVLGQIPKFSLSSQKDRQTMDIKTLPHNLREEVSCPVCTNIYTEPKHLPCRHSFCLQCLKHWHRSGHGRDTITCPKCQLVSRVPGSGDLADLPTSVHLNALIDVLAIKECKTSQADVETVKRRAPRVLTVSSVACFGVKSALLHITSFKAIKITVF